MAERAREVCRQLEIPHHVVDHTARFDKQVVEPFCSEYRAGGTPNPCVRCNALVKWPSLLGAASDLGCLHVATGHYARVGNEGERVQILRGADRSKDQSYALYGLPQDALSRTWFPLGSMTKEQVRTIAEQASLVTSGTGESQDICFIPEGDYRGFLAHRVRMLPGPIHDTEGNVLGTHQGLPAYTIGQRKGLGIPAGRPLYVIEKDAAENLLVVGPREALCKRDFTVTGVNWVSVPCPATGTRLEADLEVRYRTKPIRAELEVESSDSVTVHLPQHDQAIAPGQSAVWYRGDVLLGGGIIQG
jgi:tRNA-specific 2-thiouridylase